ncbi:MAG: serine hydrolase [Elusimicrobiales bacterium]
MMQGRAFFLLFTAALCLGAWRLGIGMDFSRGFAGLPFGRPFTPPAEVLAAASWPPERAARWRQMTQSLEKMAARFPGRMGIYVKDLKSGTQWQYQADELFPSASLIKVPIMAAIFEKLRRNEIELEDEITLKRGEKRGGSGHLRRLRYGTKLTVRQLVEKMITESDNTATRMLVDCVGLDYLQAQFSRMGLKMTGIYPEGLSLSSKPVARENYTTPREMSMLIESMYRGELVDKTSSEAMLDIMKRLKTHSRFAKYLPRGWELAHKTGLLRQACHDTGVVFSPSGDYVLAIMTWKVPDYRFAANYIARMADMTYRSYDNRQPPAAARYPRRKHGKR